MPQLIPLTRFSLIRSIDAKGTM